MQQPGALIGPDKHLTRESETMKETKVIEYDNGDRYEGEVNAKGQRHGWGVMTWSNGGRREGEWKNGRAEYKWKNGMPQTVEEPPTTEQPKPPKPLKGLLGHKPPGPLELITRWLAVAAMIGTPIFVVTLIVKHNAAQEVQQEIQDAEDRKKGFHCLSAWNGSHREFVKLVKNRMNDPDSFEHVETRVTSVQSDGKHVITMQFRGRNAFGGIVKNTAIGSYWPNCSPVLDGIL